MDEEKPKSKTDKILDKVAKGLVATGKAAEVTEFLTDYTPVEGDPYWLNFIKEIHNIKHKDDHDFANTEIPKDKNIKRETKSEHKERIMKMVNENFNSLPPETKERLVKNTEKMFSDNNIQ
jgi:hypothetical protein